jgi:CheY-like chemotaxis protein
MSFVEYACIFVRATGDRLLAAERLVCGLPHLFGPELIEVDLAHRAATGTLLVLARFDESHFDAGTRARLAFWTARAGGRASPVEALSGPDREAFQDHLAGCEHVLRAVSREAIYDRCEPLFTQVGAAAGRRRNPADRPLLTLDVGGPGWEGVSYQREGRAMFIAGPMSPPVGDEVFVVFRIPSVVKPIAVRARVHDVREPSAAGPGRPAGFTLRLPDGAPHVLLALEKHAPAMQAETRAAPRYPVKAPVRVLVPPPTAPPTARAVIEYASEQELEADFVENLSQGGAFIRSPHPKPVGTAIALDFRLPNGTELKARAVVAFTCATGMGVKFTLDAEGEAALQAAIAHISARARRALVVDDDALVCRLLADALADRGFEAITAVDARGGLSVLSEEVLALDLLITDVFMPGMDGEAFVTTIREAGGESDLAIVVVTGKLEPGLERRLEQAGADAVLDKALGPELVAQAADAVLERKRMARNR